MAQTIDQLETMHECLMKEFSDRIWKMHRDYLLNYSKWRVLEEGRGGAPPPVRVPPRLPSVLTRSLSSIDIRKKFSDGIFGAGGRKTK